jgi:hypothetical protein
MKKYNERQISLLNLSNDDKDYLKTNYNTGFEYELSIGYLLLSKISKKSSSILINDVILHHPKANVICQHIKRISYLKKYPDIEQLIYNDILVTTQNDEVGPSDLVLKLDDNVDLGLSIKYENKCNINLSGKHFLTNDSLQYLRSLLPIYIEKYIREMKNEYGDIKNWFRKRKKSSATSEYIQLIIDRVIHDWIYVEQEKILKRFYHYDSAIDYWIITIPHASSRDLVDIEMNTKKLISTKDVIVKQYSESMIEFSEKGKIFATMQVKFNNGILERYHKYPDKYRQQPNVTDIEGKSVKRGDPFGSWNINIV